MASGHVNRTNRPNTWLHRPACKREEKPCQLGAVHTWHDGDIARSRMDFRFRWNSGHTAETGSGLNGHKTKPRHLHERAFILIAWANRSSFSALAAVLSAHARG
jgi:hypothetical protein